MVSEKTREQLLSMWGIPIGASPLFTHHKLLQTALLWQQQENKLAA